MDKTGLAVAARYSYPPNSLSLCGPNQQKNLNHYTVTGEIDGGTKEILEQFQTLYPYLCFIAGENHVKDAFDKRVIEAYWLGNALLHQTRASDFLHFLDKETPLVKQKVVKGALPHHAFHVLNIYKRTGHLKIPHTIETMDACIINWGKIIQINNLDIIVETKPLRLIETLSWGNPMKRKLRMQGIHDRIFPTLSVGDYVSYHWGYVCEKLSALKLRNLKFYTNLALHYANFSSR